MNIDFSEEQDLLRNSLQRVLRERYDFDTRRAIVASDEGWSRKHWATFAELGLLAAPLPENFGGIGDGPLAAMIIAQEFGRRLVVEPFIETVVIAGGLIEALARPEQREDWLSGIAGGQSIWALAWSEQGGRFDLANVETRAARKGDTYVLYGAKASVIAAPWADRIIVSARTSGEPRDRDGVSLFIVDREQAGMHLKSFRTIDGRRAADIELNNVLVPADHMLGADGVGVTALEACRDRAIGALCAEALGAMSELNDATLTYSKTRKQFGVALGTFQVLQHRMVDMFIAHQEALSLMQHLNLSLLAPDVRISTLASGAKAKISANARFVGQQAVQLHGGMGMSEELNVGHYFKRLTAIDTTFGDGGYHLMRFAQAS